MKNIRKVTICTALLILLTALVACGDDGTETQEIGEGQYEVAVYGEAFIEEGIPQDAFLDGWSVTFDRFLIVIDEITLGELAMGSGPKVYDLALPSGGLGHTHLSETVPAGTYGAFGYTVGPRQDATAGNVSAEVAETMVSEGLSILVEGTATKEGQSVSFVWGFDSETRYAPCEIGERVEDGGVGASQITIHADHLFYDDLVSEEPNVAFDLIASADSDGDGRVTLEELSAIDLSTQARYQVGSAPINDLKGFVEAQTNTLGHIDGEGHCDGQ